MSASAPPAPSTPSTPTTSTTPLVQIMYASETTGIAEPELELLLTKSRVRNAAADVTGMLLVGEGRILQVLEGPVEAVQRLYAIIERDPRHHHCRVLRERTILERDFARWSMGYQPLSGERLRGLPGFVDFFAADFDAVDFRRQGGAPRFLLLAFRDQPTREP